MNVRISICLKPEEMKQQNAEGGEGMLPFFYANEGKRYNPVKLILLKRFREPTLFACEMLLICIIEYSIF